jgi:hypothetical protein
MVLMDLQLENLLAYSINIRDRTRGVIHTYMPLLMTKFGKSGKIRLGKTKE